MYWALIWLSIKSSSKATLTRLSTSVYSSPGIWWNFAIVKPLMQCLTLLKYLCIRYSLASHIPFTWLMINCEFPWTTIDSASNDLDKSKPLMRASYLALLFVIWNCRRTTYSKLSPSGDCKITPTPLACWVDDPFFCPLVFILLVMNWSKLCNEIRKCLGFYCFSWSIPYIKLTEFNCPLDQSFSYL